MAAWCLVTVSACANAASPVAIDEGTASELRLGYFGNLTHAPAVLGVSEGLIEDELGDTALSATTFSAGPAAVEALFSGALDAVYIGPNPAINAFARSDGEAVRIVSGATSGGAQLVVRPDISTAEDLRGATIASPSIGNTQDVALRAWLRDQGFETKRNGTGDVNITPTENAQSLREFQAGRIDGAWVPEPWASRLVLEGGGKVLIDERDLHEDGQFVTTHLVVRADYLERFPRTVEGLLQGHLNAVDLVNDDPEAAKDLVNDRLEELTTRRLTDDVIDRAWDTLTVTPDPVATSLQDSATDAADVGLTVDVDLDGIYDLSILNQLLRSRGEQPVSAAGLGKE
jgi:NitT/TauT family transport system substrate-binding protein